MAWGSEIAARAQSLYNNASNAIDAYRFNRRAYDEAHKEHCDFANDDMDCNVEFDSEEEWTAVTKVPREMSNEPDEPFAVKQSSAKLDQLRSKISQIALEAASEAAGVSLFYTKWAIKYTALELAHNVGFLANCKTATDIVQAIKTRFPVVEDIQRAYKSGHDAGRHGYETRAGYQPPQSGITHPRHVQVPSNLDDIPLITDETIRQNLAKARGRPIYDPETRAELEVVLESQLKDEMGEELGGGAVGGGG